jgi:hypothetical protein
MLTLALVHVPNNGLDGLRPQERLEVLELPLHSIHTVHLHSHIKHQSCGGVEEHTVLSVDSRDTLHCAVETPCIARAAVLSVLYDSHIILRSEAILLVASTILRWCPPPLQN